MGEIVLLLAVGFAGGFAGGLLGIGGGAIYVPAMVLLLEENQHLAQGASLAAIVATGLVAGPIIVLYFLGAGLAKLVEGNPFIPRS